MKGILLGFNISTSEGVISGDDAERYSFSGTEWKETEPPMKGKRVDFIVDGSIAKEVYSISEHKPSEDSWYKSSDDKLISGVCSGLAHKFNVSVLGMRIAMVILSLFLFVPVVLYIVLWLLLPAKPTKA